VLVLVLVPEQKAPPQPLLRLDLGAQDIGLSEVANLSEVAEVLWEPCF
jgi:hypothetical protein